MKCALFIDPQYSFWQNYFLLYRFRPPKEGPLQNWELSGENKNISIPVLPLYCHRTLKHLQKGSKKASASGCGLYIMDRGYASLLRGEKLPIADGRRWALATMCTRLSKDHDNWQQMKVSIEVNNAFGTFAARLLAKEARYLTLFSDKPETRRTLCQTIYEECGLICHSTAKPPADAKLIIYTPQDKELTSSISASKEINKDSLLWQGWATHAHNHDGQIMEGYMAEGLLMAAAWDKLQVPMMEQLPQILSKSRYYGLAPLAGNKS